MAVRRYNVIRFLNTTQFLSILSFASGSGFFFCVYCILHSFSYIYHSFNTYRFLSIKVKMCFILFQGLLNKPRKYWMQIYVYTFYLQVRLKVVYYAKLLSIYLNKISKFVHIIPAYRQMHIGTFSVFSIHTQWYIGTSRYVHIQYIQWCYVLHIHFRSLSINSIRKYIASK